jgi:excisionase family DNA binding protein
MKYSNAGMLNTAEAARLLRVSQASIRRWADSGRLRSSRVGGRRERRFQESDLVAFLEGGQPGGEHSVSIGGIAVPVPGHTASFYTTDEGGLRLSLPFLAEGLRLGQPCILVAAEPYVSRYRAALGDAARSGLTIVAFHGGTATEAITEWEDRFAQLVAGGAKVIRAVGEMAAERTMFDSEEEMLRYEEAFQLMSKRYPVAVICQYDVRAFDGVALVRALKAHPDMFGFRIGSFLN